MSNPELRLVRRRQVRLAAAVGFGLCVAGWTSSPAVAVPLNPNSFPSLGTLNPAAGTYTINTSFGIFQVPTLVVGATTYIGEVVEQGPGLPDIAVFTFDSVTIGNASPIPTDAVNINAIGLRPVAILSKSDIAIHANGAIRNSAGAAAGGPGAGGSSEIGGGGGGFGGAGSGSGGGQPYGDLLIALQPGSGGGNGGGSTGGAGGGAVELGAVGNLAMGAGAQINSHGFGGGSGSPPTGSGAGGGSGGGVLLHAATVDLAAGAAVRADGAGGGFIFGGDGGGGRFTTRVETLTVGGPSYTPGISLAGANAGVANLYVETLVVPTGKSFSFSQPPVQITAKDIDIQAGAFVSTLGSYANTGSVGIGQSSLFTATGSIGGGRWRPANATIVAGGGSGTFDFGGNTEVIGRGTIAARIAAPTSGSILQALGGALVVGDPNSTAGVDFDGQLRVGTLGGPVTSDALILLDADRALIGATNIGAGASLRAPNGITLRAGRQLSATAGAATVDGNFVNGGIVNGPTATGQFLTFTDDVSGTGGYSGNIAFSDGFSPGASPARVVIDGNMQFDGSTSLLIELGGTTRGVQYDAIDVTGAATLAGHLAVTLIDGFTPVPGTAFDVLHYGSRTGDMTVVNQTGLAGLSFQKNYSGTGLTLLARGFPGDANLNGTTDISDFATLATNFNTAGNWFAGNFDDNGVVDIGDFAILAANFNRTAPRAATVPEPVGLGALAMLAVFGGRRRR